MNKDHFQFLGQLAARRFVPTWALWRLQPTAYSSGSSSDTSSSESVSDNSKESRHSHSLVCKDMNMLLSSHPCELKLNIGEIFGSRQICYAVSCMCGAFTVPVCNSCSQCLGRSGRWLVPFFFSTSQNKTTPIWPETNHPINRNNDK